MNEKATEMAIDTERPAALYCVDDGAYLLGIRLDQRVYPASVTKLITAVTALRYLDTDACITVGKERALVEDGSSLCLLLPGHRLKFRDMLKGLLLPSGCDAAYSIAAAAARAAYPEADLDARSAVQRFAEMMNRCAADLGMKDSHFVNPSGWDNPAHYTTARDLVLLGVHVLSQPVLRETVSTAERYVVFDSGETITWRNTNRLLQKEEPYYCPDAMGVKTGTSNAGGASLLGAFRRNDKTYLSYVSGCEDNGEIYRKTLKIISEYT